jgi:hypothetical protein
MHAAAGQPPDQERVDRAEQDLAPAAAVTEAGNRLQQVDDLRGRKIRIEQQAGAAADFGPAA